MKRPPLYPERKVRTTIRHAGSKTRPQHVYVRCTDRVRARYNSCMGGFKHFAGADATGAELFEKFGLPAMEAELKRLIDEKRDQQG